MMIARQIRVAWMLVCFGLRPQLLAAVLFHWIGLVARHGLHPVVRLLEERGFPRFIGHSIGFERQRLGGGAKRGLADGFGLKKIPAIGRLDVERNAFCLRALAEHFGEREEER